MPGIVNLNGIIVDRGIGNRLNLLQLIAENAISDSDEIAKKLVDPKTLTSVPPADIAISLQPNHTAATLGTVADPIEPIFKPTALKAPKALGLNLVSVTPPVLGSILKDPLPLNIPLPPDLDVGDVPKRSFNVNTSITTPAIKKYTLPLAPKIVDLKLPVLKAVSVVPFTLATPSFNSHTLPSSSWVFHPTRYTSTLVTDVQKVLINRLKGGSGLSSTSEKAIWNRDRDRELAASRLAESTLLNTRSGQGFTRPTGSLYSVLDGLVQEAQSKIIELSRELAIKQAELEQKNMESSIAQVISLEEVLTRAHSDLEKLRFDVLKYDKDIQLEVYKLSLSTFSTQIEMYKAYTTVYEAKLKSELNKLEEYRALLDGSKIRLEENSQDIEVYKAGIEAVRLSVDVYKAEVDAVNERVAAEELKLKVYSSDLEAYDLSIKAKASEYNLYSEQIKGELAKTQVYDSQVKGYAAKVQAYGVEADVAMKVADMKSDLEELKIKQYTIDTDVYIKQLQNDQLKYQSAVDIYKGQAEVFSSKVGLNKAIAEIDLKNIENTISQNKAYAEVAIENAKLKIANLSSTNANLIEAKKAAGSIYQAIGASALSAINVSSSESIDNNFSINESHSYDGV